MKKHKISRACHEAAIRLEQDAALAADPKTASYDRGARNAYRTVRDVIEGTLPLEAIR